MYVCIPNGPFPYVFYRNIVDIEIRHLQACTHKCIYIDSRDSNFSKDISRWEIFKNTIYFALDAMREIPFVCALEMANQISPLSSNQVALK